MKRSQQLVFVEANAFRKDRHVKECNCTIMHDRTEKRRRRRLKIESAHKVAIFRQLLKIFEKGDYESLKLRFLPLNFPEMGGGNFNPELTRAKNFR